MTNDSKKEEEKKGNKSEAGNSQLGSESEKVDKSIEPYTSYRNALHGLSPVWKLPELDKNVKISFPEISS